MPTIYEVQAPDGSILEIEGQDNATQQQIMQAAQSLYAQQQQQETAVSLEEQVARATGVSPETMAPPERGA